MNCPNTAIIVITGQPMITEEQALQAGADGFISKNNALRPTRVIQLISTLVAKICGTSNDTVKHQLVLHEKAATEVSEQFKKNE
jgi:DNA-binding NarL/FixJ family response regulator